MKPKQTHVTFTIENRSTPILKLLEIVNVIHFINTSDLQNDGYVYFLQISEIVQELQEFIISSLHASNCLRYQSLAHKLKLTSFKSKIDRFVDWNFKSLLKEPDFLAMSAEHLIEVISSENLRVKREEAVYEAVYRWFRQDISGR